MLIKRIKQQWQLSLLVLLFLPLLLRLGYWQAERAEEKQQLLAVYQQQQNLPAQKFSELLYSEIPYKDSDVSYRPVIITGTYNSTNYWLLDNQPRQGKVGYEVVMPLTVDLKVNKKLNKNVDKKLGGKPYEKSGSEATTRTILVNRGWVQAPRLRSELPLIETPTEKLTIKGYFYTPSLNAIFRHAESNSSDLLQAWPKRVLALTSEQAETVLSTTVYPQVLRINDESPSALITEWPVINTLPEKHYGYSVQWFAMALALVCLYAWAIFRRPD